MLGAAVVGAAASSGLLRAAEGLTGRPAEAGRAAPRWLARTNHQGRPVSLVAGPVLAVAATTVAAAGAPDRRLRAALLVAGLGTGAVGCYDDVAGARPRERADKGFRGHLAALRQGRVSAGVVKAGGIGAVALAAGALLTPAPAGAAAPTPAGAALRALPAALAAGVVAGTANLVNLFDLRPGRALKVGLLLGVPLLPGPAAGPPAAATVGAAAGLLPADLRERVMLGDTGANALGALLGVLLVASTGTGGRAAALVVLVALTAASERVSFTRVIEATPGLRTLDALGRRPPVRAPAR